MIRPRLDNLDQSTFDVVVVGAGATGCASAKELARRGYSVLLIDRGDIGAGTSSRSSRLLYCGLAYMKPDYPLWKIPFRPLDMVGRIYRAWLTMRCRAELVRAMPERLTRRRFYFPYRDRKDSGYPAALIDLGFRLLSCFGSRDAPLGYKRLPSEKAGKESGLVAALRPGVKSVGAFYEYQYSWPERICVDTALEAESYGACIRTYTKATSLEKNSNGWSLRVTDSAPGGRGEARISARVVINAAGPWIDQVNSHSESGGSHREVLGVKGVNVLVKLPDSFQGQGLEALSSRGEPFYIFPWGSYHFLGPTETRVDADPDDIRVSEAEIAYLLSEANAQFSDLELKSEDVIHAWCGVRPSSTRDGKTLSGVIQLNEQPETPGLISVTGVMIMLHRHAGRLVARAVERRLGAGSGRKARATDSKRRTVNTFTETDIDRIARTEHVVTLSDLMQRRLPFGWNADLGKSRVEEMSRIAAEALGWSEERRREECKVYDDYVSDHFIQR